MGGPSAALVLADLAKLGVSRAVRIGTCAATEPGLGGELLLVDEGGRRGGGPARRRWWRAASPDRTCRA